MVDSVHCGDALLTIRCMAADRPRAQRAGQLGGPGGKVKWGETLEAALLQEAVVIKAPILFW
jgi:hypothetical protein